MIAREPAWSSLAFDPRPVSFGSLASQLGVRPPGEIPSRRRIILADVLLLADRYGLPLEAPPRHPFNSLWALRSVAAVADPALALRLAIRYFQAAWGEGRSLEDLSVLRSCLADLGIDQDPEVTGTGTKERAAVKAHTRALIELGGWGVPTFVWQDLLFFGHDRLSLLVECLSGGRSLDRAKHAAILSRPG